MVTKTTTLISRDELSAAALESVFRQAGIDAAVSGQGVRLAMDGLAITATPVAERGYVFLSVVLGINSGTTSEQVLELCNRINEGLAFVTAFLNEGFFQLQLCWHLDTAAGVTAEEVVDQARRFRAAVRGAVQKDTEHVLLARPMSFVQKCLEPAFVEHAEPRDAGSDPSFKVVLDPLNAGDLATAAAEAEKLAARCPDLDLGYLWWGGALMRGGKLNEARKVCRRGLERSRRKYMLCGRLAEVNWRAGVLGDAVYWWAQAVHCLESVPDQRGESGPYLYLQHVAVGAGEPDVAAAFGARAGQIRPGVGLDAPSAQSLAGPAWSQQVPQLRDVLTELRARYAKPRADGAGRKVQGMLIMTAMPVPDAHVLLTQIIDQQLKRGNEVVKDVVVKVETAGTNLDDRAYAYAAVRQAFADLGGADLADRTERFSFQASNGNRGYYYLAFDRPATATPAAMASAALA